MASGASYRLEEHGNRAGPRSSACAACAGEHKPGDWPSAGGIFPEAGMRWWPRLGAAAAAQHALHPEPHAVAVEAVPQQPRAVAGVLDGLQDRRLQGTELIPVQACFAL